MQPIGPLDICGMPQTFGTCPVGAMQKVVNGARLLSRARWPFLPGSAANVSLTAAKAHSPIACQRLWRPIPAATRQPRLLHRQRRLTTTTVELYFWQLLQTKFIDLLPLGQIFGRWLQPKRWSKTSQIFYADFLKWEFACRCTYIAKIKISAKSQIPKS